MKDTIRTISFTKSTVLQFCFECLVYFHSFIGRVMNIENRYYAMHKMFVFITCVELKTGLISPFCLELQQNVNSTLLKVKSNFIKSSH